MSEVILENGVSIKGGGGEILNGLIGDLFDQDNVSAEYNQTLMEKLGLTPTRPLNLEETFDIMVGSGELDEIEEGQNIPEIDTEKGNGKGFELTIFAGKYKVSKQFIKWVEASQTLENADSSVQKEWARIARNIKGLDRSKIKTKNKLFAELLSLGWSSTNPYGPGSLTPYGKTLFATDHPYLRGTKEFSNTIGDLELETSSLKTAINQIKVECRLQNGDFVEIPKEYELLVPRQLETKAREILNNDSKFAGTGNNSALENVFMFEGSRVKLVVLDTLGSLDKNGNLVGSATMWFLYNKEYARIANAARYIELYPAEIGVYMNDDNNNHYIKIDMSCTVDHYGLEQFMIGSRGTVAV